VLILIGERQQDVKPMRLEGEKALGKAGFCHGSVPINIYT
jgi:hypothetical protein